MWFTLAGLALNFLGTVALGFVLPGHSVNLVTERGPTSAPADATGRTAQRLGWPLMAAGFLLQGIGAFTAR